jgi:ParB-like chromosome segregation protein Spo0J
MPTLLRELEAVEQLHDAFGFTYRDLAATVNTSESNLHRWRSANGAPPTPVFLARLAALGAFVRSSVARSGTRARLVRRSMSRSPRSVGRRRGR